MTYRIIKGRRSYLAWDRGAFSDAEDDTGFEVAVEAGMERSSSRYVVRAFLARPRPVLWLAGWKGQYTECLACSKFVPCPKCSRYEDEHCPVCKGLGQVERGTGGEAFVDGEEWEYTRYIRVKRQVKNKFWKTSHRIEQVKHCRQCSGRGRIPIGRVFGLGIPDAVFDKGNSHIVLGRRGSKESVDELERVVEELSEFRQAEVLRKIGNVAQLVHPFVLQHPLFRTWKSWAPAFIPYETGQSVDTLLEGVM